MADQIPSYLTQGEPARLFPALSTTSKEGRTTSIVLASLTKVEELGAALLATVGQKVGKNAEIYKDQYQVKHLLRFHISET